MPTIQVSPEISVIKREESRASYAQSASTRLFRHRDKSIPLLSDRGLNLLARVLIITLWSASLFELGIPLFLDRIGFSLFFLCGLTLLFFAPLYLSMGHLKLPIMNPQNPTVILLALLFIYSFYEAANLLWSQAPSFSLFYTMQSYWYLVLFLITFLIMRSKSELQITTDLSAIGLTTLAVFSLLTIIAWQRGYGWGVFADVGTFRFALFRDYNMYLQCVLIALSLSMVRVRGPKPHPKHLLLYIIGLFVAVLIGVLSGSRRSIILYVPIAFGVILLLILTQRRRSGLLIAFLTIASVGLFAFSLSLLSGVFRAGDFGAAWALDGTFRNAARGFGFLTGDYADISGRRFWWGQAVEVIQDFNLREFLTGIGKRAFFEDARFWTGDGGRRSPHNFVLSAMIEGGVIKLMLLLSIIFSLLAVAVRLIRFDFWQANAALSNLLIWIASVSISGAGFFNARIVFLVILAVLLSNEIRKRYKVIERSA